MLEEENAKKVNASGSETYIYGQNASRSTILEGDNYQSQLGNAFIPRNCYGHSSSNTATNGETEINEFEIDDATRGRVVKGVYLPTNEAAQANCLSEMTIKGSTKTKKLSRPPKTKCSKSPKSTLKAPVDLCCPEVEMKGQISDEPGIAEQCFLTHYFI